MSLPLVTNEKITEKVSSEWRENEILVCSVGVGPARYPNDNPTRRAHVLLSLDTALELGP